MLRSSPQHLINNYNKLLCIKRMLSSTTKRVKEDGVVDRIQENVRREMGGGGSAIWSAMTELARGPNIVADLGQGFPNFGGDKIARLAASNAVMSDGRVNQYSLVNGAADLRAAISSHAKKMYPAGARLDANKEVLITSSGTESLFAAMASVIRRGDEVIVFEPSFPWYAPNIRLFGGIVKTVQLKFPDFAMKEAEVRAAFTPKTKLVVFNTPHNPTGHVARKSEVEHLARLCVEHNVVCVSDEVYDCFVFDDGLKHHRIMDEPGMKERTLTVGTASKMLSLTGWRVGWLHGPEDLIAACRAVHSFTSYCAPTPLQEGVRAALEAATADELGLPADIRNLNRQFLSNAKRLVDALATTFPGVVSAIPEGGYFLVSDIAALHMTDAEFCNKLAKERGVVAVPMQVFFSSDKPVTNLVRFAICKDVALIDKAVQAILRRG